MKDDLGRGEFSRVEECEAACEAERKAEICIRAESRFREDWAWPGAGVGCCWLAECLLAGGWQGGEVVRENSR